MIVYQSEQSRRPKKKYVLKETLIGSHDVKQYKQEEPYAEIKKYELNNKEKDYKSYNSSKYIYKEYYYSKNNNKKSYVENHITSIVNKIILFCDKQEIYKIHDNQSKLLFDDLFAYFISINNYNILGSVLFNPNHLINYHDKATEYLTSDLYIKKIEGKIKYVKYNINRNFEDKSEQEKILNSHNKELVCKIFKKHLKDYDSMTDEQKIYLLNKVSMILLGELPVLMNAIKRSIEEKKYIYTNPNPDNSLFFRDDFKKEIVLIVTEKWKNIPNSIIAGILQCIYTSMCFVEDIYSKNQKEIDKVLKNKETYKFEEDKTLLESFELAFPGLGQILRKHNMSKKDLINDIYNLFFSEILSKATQAKYKQLC